MSDGVIGFAAFKNEDEQRYAVRGCGTVHDEFVEWMKTKAYEVTSMDWPWTNFRFTDQAHEAEFVAKYDVPGNYFDRSIDV